MTLYTKFRELVDKHGHCLCGHGEWCDKCRPGSIWHVITKELDEYAERMKTIEGTAEECKELCVQFGHTL